MGVVGILLHASDSIHLLIVNHMFFCLVLRWNLATSWSSQVNLDKDPLLPIPSLKLALSHANVEASDERYQVDNSTTG
jgi:hypothetical protein